MNTQHTQQVHKVVWAIITAVLIASGTYLINSKVQNSEMNASLDKTNYRVEVVEDKVIILNNSLRSLQLSKATTDEATANLEKAVEKISQVTDKLYTAVIKLEERSKSQ